MGLPPESLFAEIYRIHGHRCPMSTLGGRLGFAARERLAGTAPFSATYYISTCAADGISVMTDCKKADGSLRIVEGERHALWLKSHDGDGIFAELSSKALKLAGDYRALDQALQEEETNLSPDEQQLRRAAKNAAFEELLQKLEAAEKETASLRDQLKAILEKALLR